MEHRGLFSICLGIGTDLRGRIRPIAFDPRKVTLQGTPASLLVHFLHEGVHPDLSGTSILSREVSFPCLTISAKSFSVDHLPFTNIIKWRSTSSPLPVSCLVPRPSPLSIPQRQVLASPTSKLFCHRRFCPNHIFSSTTGKSDHSCLFSPLDWRIVLMWPVILRLLIQFLKRDN